MAYKCKNCGKFVAKGAVICKHCGQENPAELVITNATSESVVTKMQSSVEEPIQIKCPNCGNALTLPKQFQKDYYLVCNICNQNFANPLKLMGRGENFLKKYGCLIFVIFFAVVVIISYATSSDDNLKADGKTVYYITEDIYAPSNEETAKEMINAIVKNPNDPITMLDYMYNNEENFTHVFANDKVVILKKVSSGYLIRKLRDYKTAILPNESYFRE